MDSVRAGRLLDVGRSLIAELDPEAVLDQLLAVAIELTGARYAAIGVLDDSRQQLERFLTRGIDEDTHRAIGDLPRGRGVLGVLIREPRPLRLKDVGAHPESYGFPLAHPPMHSFLGVPIVVHGEAWGNLYLTEKADGEFTDDDEEAITVLADWAAIAIANSRLYRDVRRRNDDLQRVIRGLETTTEIARALGGVTDLDRVLELVAKRSRALIDARATGLTLIDGEDLVVAAAAGEGVEGLRGTRLALADSFVGTAAQDGRPHRVHELPASSFAARELHARTALVAPMMFRNRPIGFLTAFDRLEGDAAFTDEDERLMQAFAASAATAVATAQSASEEAVRRSLSASEEERRRWARELHDETLQELAGLKVLISGARRTHDLELARTAMDQSLEIITSGIANLRALITELRPAALDELGAQPALEALAMRMQAQNGIEIELEVDFAYEQGRSAARHAPELELAIYRLVQEALNNVIKHAEAERVTVRVAEDDTDGVVLVEVRDDGRGFDTRAASEGFGLLGMRERVEAVHGSLAVDSTPGGGTRLIARLPITRRSPASGSVAEGTPSHAAPIGNP
jgi:signal transduction histidine kinase